MDFASKESKCPNLELILVTGATGKVGQVFIKRLLADPKFNSFTVRALCHNRELEPHERIQNIHGSIEHREVVEKAMDGVTHVVHLATVQRNSRSDHGCGGQRFVLAA